MIYDEFNDLEVGDVFTLFGDPWLLDDDDYFDEGRQLICVHPDENALDTYEMIVFLDNDGDIKITEHDE